MSEIMIYTKHAQSEKFSELSALHMALVVRKEEFISVSDDTQLARALEFSAQCKAAARQWDDDRVRLQSGARLTIKMLNEEMLPGIEEMRSAAEIAGSACKVYMNRKLELQRREEAARRQELGFAEEEARKARVAASLAPEKLPEALEAAAKVNAVVEAIVVADETATDYRRVEGVLGSKSTLVARWTWRLVDIALVPEAYLRPPEERLNNVALNKLATTLKAAAVGTSPVPGIEFFNDPILSQRTSR